MIELAFASAFARTLNYHIVSQRILTTHLHSCIFVFFCFLFSPFLTLLFLSDPCMRSIELASVGFCAHAKLAYRIATYRAVISSTENVFKHILVSRKPERYLHCCREAGCYDRAARRQ